MFDSIFNIFPTNVPSIYTYIILFVLLCLLKKIYFNGSKCSLKQDLTSKVVIITGANRGLGKETCKELVLLGATVVMACRDVQKAEETKKEIINLTNCSKMDIMALDLSDLQSVRSFSEKFKAKYSRLDILINNAGIIAPERRLTKEGFESMIGVNLFGHFLLTSLLLDHLKITPSSRILNLSSLAHWYGYLNLEDINSEKFFDYNRTYGGSKLAIILFTNQLASKLEGTGVKVCSLHPGAVRSGFSSNLINSKTKGNILLKGLIALVYPIWWLVTKNVQQGVQTILYCALINYELLQHGKYYSDCKVCKTRGDANNKEKMEKLWEICEKMVKIR